MIERHDDLAELLRQLDHPVPRVSVDEIIARARPGRRWAGASIAAATIVVAGIAAALPSSPVHHALLRAIAGAPRELHRPDTVATHAAKQGAGVALVPQGWLTVRFAAPLPESRVRVVIVAGEQLSLVPEGGDAAFSVGDASIVVREATTPTFTLTVPNTLSGLSLESDGALRFEKRGPTITTRAPRDAQGAYLVQLGGPRP